jgi:hypothetical protein
MKRARSTTHHSLLVRGSDGIIGSGGVVVVLVVEGARVVTVADERGSEFGIMARIGWCKRRCSRGRGGSGLFVHGGMDWVELRRWLLLRGRPEGRGKEAGSLSTSGKARLGSMLRARSSVMNHRLPIRLTRSISLASLASYPSDRVASFMSNWRFYLIPCNI